MPIEDKGGYRVWTKAPVPRGFDGITLGRTIMFRNASASPRLVRHELVHVRQWADHGMVGFALRYVMAYLRNRVLGHGHMGAYRRIPLEVEAYWLERQSIPSDDEPRSLRRSGDANHG